MLFMKHQDRVYFIDSGGGLGGNCAPRVLSMPNLKSLIISYFEVQSNTFFYGYVSTFLMAIHVSVAQ